jgi:predicted nuclease with TOPRIM domain
MSLNNLISNIEKKLSNLLSSYENLKDKNLKLVDENNKLISKIEDNSQIINSLNDKIKIMSISKSVDVSKNDIKQTKLKINEYIREIDKCIAQLNN